MKVLIVEDESIAADKLERQLLQLDATIEVCAKIESVTSTVKWLQQHPVDLIFLDIHLSDGLSFRIFDEVEVTAPIIFTTAYDQYAIQAFKVNSIDYLLKPINKYDLAQSLEKYNTLHPQQVQPDYKALFDSLTKNQEAYQKRFMVVTGEKIMTVPSEEVAYFFAEGKYVFLVHQDGDRYLIDYTLDKLHNLLDPAQFFRANRQIIVHIDAIKTMHSWFKRRIKLEMTPAFDKEVIVSSERMKDFKLWLNS